MQTKHLIVWVSVMVWLMTVLNCQDKSSQQKTTSKKTVDDISVLAALPTEVPAPRDNPTTPEKVALGRLLFFDPILSGSKDVACATCHHPEFGYAEMLDISIGVNGRGMGSHRTFISPNDIPFVKRNAQTVLNTAFNGLTLKTLATPEEAPMFWDLRVKSLEKQALEPIKALEEMRGRAWSESHALDSAIARVGHIAEYQRLFKNAFGGENPVNVTHLSQALAAYERTLVGGNSRFDQYIRGDQTALSLNEIEGLQAFLKSGCAKCHNGPMFSDFQVHTLGVPDNEKLTFIDDGVNKTFGFRTPTLRNLRYTAPYMHSGKLQTLQQVLEFYEDLSGDKIRNAHVTQAQLDPLLESLRVDFKDISLIVEFLNTLNDDHFDRTIPARVPSGLKVGGEIQ